MSVALSLSCAPVTTPSADSAPDDVATVDDVREDTGSTPDTSVALDGGIADARTLPVDASAVSIAPIDRRNSGPSGELDVRVQVRGHRSFMVVANTDNAARTSVLSVTDPRGATIFRWQDWFNGARRITRAIFAERTGLAFNWPVRAEDPALVDGDYTVRIGTYRVDGTTPRPNIDVDVTTILNSDRELDAGRVRVAIVWANGLQNDSALVSATQRAVDHWRAVWRPVGIDFDVRYVTSSIPPALP